MANEYLYGAYGHIGETVAQSAVQAGTTPVYIGTAPVNLVRGFGEAGIINAPIKITSLVDAQKKIGYSSDWGTFTLCEAVYAHFNNTLGNIGPIFVIIVLDPSAGKHRKETAFWTLCPEVTSGQVVPKLRGACLVAASCVSFASARWRKLTRSAAAPLPTKSDEFVVPHVGNTPQEWGRKPFRRNGNGKQNGGNA